MDEHFHGAMARNRAALYHWFAMAFFRPPGEQDIAEMRGGKQHALLNSLEVTPGASQGIAAMRRVLSNGSVADVTAALGTAHTRLLDGAGGFASAPPYRSFYGSDEGLLCQQATGEMDRALRQHRMRLEEGICEPADHLAIQLDTMAQLALRVAEEAQIQERPLSLLLAEEADFLDAQLLNWVAQFAERLAAVDELGYHAGLASVLVAFLTQDRAGLAEN